MALDKGVSEMVNWIKKGIIKLYEIYTAKK